MKPWIELGHGYTASIGRPRRKHGVVQAPRFLVLAPSKIPNRLRPTLCAGSFVDGCAIVDHGVLSDELRRRLESAFERSR